MHLKLIEAANWKKPNLLRSLFPLQSMFSYKLWFMTSEVLHRFYKRDWRYIGFVCIYLCICTQYLFVILCRGVCYQSCACTYIWLSRPAHAGANTHTEKTPWIMLVSYIVIIEKLPLQYRDSSHLTRVSLRERKKIR